MKGDPEITGRYVPDNAVPRNHASAFDRALQEALRELSPDTEADEFTVTYGVQLRREDNPGWVIDSYIVDLEQKQR